MASSLDHRPPHQPAMPRRSPNLQNGISTPISPSLNSQTSPHRLGGFFRDGGNGPFTSSPRHDPQVEYPHQQQRALMLSKKMALNRDETVFVSSAGDVIVCRCRSSAYPPEFLGMRTEDALGKAVTECQKDLAAVCCEMDEMSANAQDTTAGLCGDWGASTSKRRTPAMSASHRSASQRGGLLGGSPADVAAHLHPHNVKVPGDSKNLAHKAFQSEPLSPLAFGFDDDSIVPIRSFEYSQSFSSYSENDFKLHNRVRPWEDLHEEKKSDSVAPEIPRRETPLLPRLMHGVPTFLAELAQVKITQVSAHPLGSHVLLISEAGLLYSYGLNEYGQLGLGTTTGISTPHRGYIMSPTIVTPLIENGGKAVACAAGVTHSLVAVMTEERRLVRSQSSQRDSDSPTSHSQRSSAAVSLANHQLYGFGRNDFMKIGLVSPKVAKGGPLKTPRGDEMETVKFPRRVALRCRVCQEIRYGPNSPPPGMFAIAASEEHSAALVHRSTGEVELYTWGNASCGALGLPQQPLSLEVQGKPSSSTVRIVPVPSFVSALSRSSNPDAQASSLLLRHRAEYPISVSLGKRCTFVTTSMGRAFSFGQSDEGMLGLGEGAVKVVQPQEISCLPNGETIASISAGATHAVALSSSGSVYAWGTLPENYVDHGNTNSPTAQGSVNTGSQAASSAGPTPNKTWFPTRVECPVQHQSRSTGRWKKAAAVSAGYDSSAIIVDSGNVLSCGKSSGRLGLGETPENVAVPRPLFGGLRLWYQKQPPQKPKQPVLETPIDNRKAPPNSATPIPRASALARGSTFG